MILVDNDARVDEESAGTTVPTVNTVKYKDTDKSKAIDENELTSE